MTNTEIFMIILALMGILAAIALYFFVALAKEMGSVFKEMKEAKETKFLTVKLSDGAVLPHRAHPTDAGLDLCTPKDFEIAPHGTAVIDTGVAVELPEGTFGLIVSKSGLFFKHDIMTTGLIDEGYRGNIGVKLVNIGDEPMSFKAGDKIAQLLISNNIVPVLDEAKTLSESARGEGGFGSTGK